MVTFVGTVQRFPQGSDDDCLINDVLLAKNCQYPFGHTILVPPQYAGLLQPNSLISICHWWGNSERGTADCIYDPSIQSRHSKLSSLLDKSSWGCLWLLPFYDFSNLIHTLSIFLYTANSSIYALFLKNYMAPSPTNTIRFFSMINCLQVFLVNLRIL